MVFLSDVQAVGQLIAPLWWPISMLIVLILLAVVLFTLSQWHRGHWDPRFVRVCVAVCKAIGCTLRTQPDIVAWKQRYPRLTRWLGRRLSPRRPTGLPLTSVIMVCTYFFLLLIRITEAIGQDKKITGFDIRLNHLFFITRSPVATECWLWVTGAGNTLQLVLVCTLITLGLVLRRQWPKLIGWFVSIGGGTISMLLMKYSIARPRPTTAAYHLSSPSFPSGHATLSTIVIIWLLVLVWQSTRVRPFRVAMSLGAIGGILLIGLSRAVLGVHFLSDVFAGWCLGLIWTLIGVMVWRILVTRFSVAAPWIKGRWWYVLLVCLLAIYISVASIVTKLYWPTVASSPTSFESTITVDPIQQFLHTGPLATETLFGTSQEPISFIVIADNDAQLITTAQAAGWSVADPLTSQSVWMLIKTVVANQGYITAPISPSFWNTQPHAIGIEQLVNDSVRTRHHARFWRTNYQTPDGYHVYVGTASLDSGLKWGITHHIDPNVDQERDKLVRDWQTTGHVASVETISVVAPTAGYNFAGDLFFTDGQAKVVRLQ